MLPLRIAALHVSPLSVPLVDPFVIASARVEATRSILVEVTLESGSDAFLGLGEGSCLHPVTREDQPDALVAVEAARQELVGFPVEPGDLGGLERLLRLAFPREPVARSAVEMAVLDALARHARRPLWAFLSGAAPAAPAPPIETDITLPILPPRRMAELARHWAAQGFRSFKVKVGRALAEDLEALNAIAGAVPGASIRADANCGFTADEALRLMAEVTRLGLRLECFEQPCAVEDVAGMARVAAECPVPVVADESVKTLEELQQVLAARAATGVNLKIAKTGSLLGAYALGRAAQAAGLPLMVGGMVETRLGMTAAAHLVAALGGVAFPDLDTAWLLREDPFEGGYQADGPRYLLPDAPGLGIRRAAGAGG
jgi:L-alanine-DL-glutamate epimerase-like enolase superfamily enzyme